MLYMAAYSCLLRVRPEGLPLTVHRLGEGGVPYRAIVVSPGHITVRLKRRKNLPMGSAIKRQCSCMECSDTCPVHVLGKWRNSLAPRSTPFQATTGQSALKALRERIKRLGSPCADTYRLHDFRRGHAQDLAASGARLNEILQAGQWRSSSFFRYLDAEELDSQAVLEAHFNMSEDEGDDNELALLTNLDWGRSSCGAASTT